MVRKQMKNNIKFIILDKFLVNLRFKDEVSLSDICTRKDLYKIGILNNLFEFSELTDDELIAYYNTTKELDEDGYDFNLWLSRIPFELSDIKHVYTYQNNALKVTGKLVYNSPANVINRRGEFSINFTLVLTLPDDSTGNLKLYDSVMTVRAGNVVTANKTVDNLIDDMSVVDFSSKQCNYGMPYNVHLILGRK